MKIKRFNENSQDIPEVGDYVIMNVAISNGQDKREEIKNYVNNTVGKIINIRTSENGKNVFHPYRDIVVVYEKVPSEIKNWFSYDRIGKYYYRTLSEKMLIAFGKTIEEVELKMRSNKYNL